MNDNLVEKVSERSPLSHQDAENPRLQTTVHLHNIWRITDQQTLK